MQLCISRCCCDSTLSSWVVFHVESQIAISNFTTHNKWCRATHKQPTLRWFPSIALHIHSAHYFFARLASQQAWSSAFFEINNHAKFQWHFKPIFFQKYSSFYNFVCYYCGTVVSNSKVSGSHQSAWWPLMLLGNRSCSARVAMFVLFTSVNRLAF